MKMARLTSGPGKNMEIFFIRTKWNCLRGKGGSHTKTVGYRLGFNSTTVQYKKITAQGSVGTF